MASQWLVGKTRYGNKTVFVNTDNITHFLFDNDEDGKPYVCVYTTDDSLVAIKGAEEDIRTALGVFG